MKLVLTILVRDEADIVDANLAYHLNRGIDFVVATDNNSCDGTLEILEAYRRMGYLQLIREPANDYAQSAWVTRMAHLAATEHGADWILHGDADEFWWPRHGSLKDVFASIPDRFGIFHAHRFDFLPRPDEDAFFAERMTVRPELPSKTQVAHRPDPAVVVGQGAHRLDETSLTRAPSWYAVDVLHFPLRSYEQFEQKVVKAGPSTTVKHWRNAHELYTRGELRSTWEARLLDDAAVDDVIARKEAAPDGLFVGRSAKRTHGTLVRDARLRDYLRDLRQEPDMDGQPVSPTGYRLSAPRSTPRADPEIGLALEVAAREREEALKESVLKHKQQARELKALQRENLALRKENDALRREVEDAREEPDDAGRRRPWLRLSGRPRSQS